MHAPWWNFAKNTHYKIKWLTVFSDAKLFFPALPGYLFSLCNIKPHRSCFQLDKEYERCWHLWQYLELTGKTLWLHVQAISAWLVALCLWRAAILWCVWRHYVLMQTWIIVAWKICSKQITKVITFISNLNLTIDIMDHRPRKCAIRNKMIDCFACYFKEKHDQSGQSTK